MNYWKTITGLYLLGFSVLIHAESYSPQCPPEISTLDQIINAPSGWEPLIEPSKNFLNGVTFYSGHPKENVSLKPEFINKKNSQWKFSPQDSIYLVCHYNNSQIDLTQQLKKNTTICTVKYNEFVKGGLGFLPKSIICIN